MRIVLQFTNTVEHATHKTSRSIKRATHKIQGFNITLTTTQVQEAIKQSTNNNTQGPNKLHSRHLKHIGPLEIAFLTSMLKYALHINIWKLANIVTIPKPNKDRDKGPSYRPISLLSVIAKRRQKRFLPYITATIPNTPTQHGYKHIKQHCRKGVQQMAPTARTITVALDMRKAFDTINIHTLIRKRQLTKIPDTIVKFIATTSRDAKPTQHNIWFLY